MGSEDAGACPWRKGRIGGLAVGLRLGLVRFAVLLQLALGFAVDCTFV